MDCCHIHKLFLLKGSEKCSVWKLFHGNRLQLNLEKTGWYLPLTPTRFRDVSIAGCGWYSTSLFKTVQLGSPSELVVTVQRASGNCGQDALCTGSSCAPIDMEALQLLMYWSPHD